MLVIFGREVFGGAADCSGKQLMLLLERIVSICPHTVWYSGDVTSIDGSWSFGSAKELQALGELKMFAGELARVPQFESGVWVAVRVGDSDIAGSAVDTEAGRSRQLKFSLIEVRAFDTTYFEVYTSDEIILGALRTMAHLEYEDE